MAMATAALCRTEGNLASTVADAKFTAPLANAEQEIRRIIEDELEALVIGYSYLDDDSNFTEDGGDSYRLSYEQIKELADGFDDTNDAGYVALIALIDTAIQANGHDALTDKDKRLYRRAGSDFRKAEVLLTLYELFMISGARLTNDGGVVADINFSSDNRTRILSIDDLKKYANSFRDRAYQLLFRWTKDPEETADHYPTYFNHPGFNLSSVPTPIHKVTNPRERYGG